MKVIITRNTFVRGVPFEAGPEAVDLPDAIARELVGIGKALRVKGDAGKGLAEEEKPSKPLPEITPDLKSLPYPVRAKVKPKGK